MKKIIILLLLISSPVFGTSLNCDLSIKLLGSNYNIYDKDDNIFTNFGDTFIINNIVNDFDVNIKFDEEKNEYLILESSESYDPKLMQKLYPLNSITFYNTILYFVIDLFEKTAKEEALPWSYEDIIDTFSRSELTYEKFLSLLMQKFENNFEISFMTEQYVNSSLKFFYDSLKKDLVTMEKDLALFTIEQYDLHNKKELNFHSSKFYDDVNNLSEFLEVYEQPDNNMRCYSEEIILPPGARAPQEVKEITRICVGDNYDNLSEDNPIFKSFKNIKINEYKYWVMVSALSQSQHESNEPGNVFGTKIDQGISNTMFGLCN